MNASFYRFVSRHRLLCNLLFDLFLCGICTYMLASIQAAPWVIIAVALFMILCTYCFCESASNQLLAIAGKALNERCDPLPLLSVGEQMKGAFSFMNRQELALIINGSRCNPMEIDWIRVWQK